MDRFIVNSVPDIQKRKNTRKVFLSSTKKPIPYWTAYCHDTWKKALFIAGVEDACFHDLRHEATSRFFERGLNVMEVAAITGHKDLRMLQRYTHLRAEDLAKKLG